MSIQRTNGASRYAQVLAARASSSNADKYGVVGAAAIGVTDAVAQGAKSLGNGIKVVAQATVSLENAAKSAVTGSLSSAKAIASYAGSAAGAVASTISKLV